MLSLFEEVVQIPPGEIVIVGTVEPRDDGHPRTCPCRFDFFDTGVADYYVIRKLLNVAEALKKHSRSCGSLAQQDVLLLCHRWLDPESAANDPRISRCPSRRRVAPLVVQHPSAAIAAAPNNPAITRLLKRRKIHARR